MKIFENKLVTFLLSIVVLLLVEGILVNLFLPLREMSEGTRLGIGMMLLIITAFAAVGITALISADS